MSPGRLVCSIIERFCIVGAVGVVLTLLVRPEPMKGTGYHFKGVFCGRVLWDYSVSGDALTVWPVWVTNYPLTHLTINTGTYHEYLVERRQTASGRR